MSFGSKEEVEVKKSNFVPKNLEPGVQKCKVLGIEAYTKQYQNDAQPRLILRLKLEAEKPNAEFEGFYIDKDNHKLGRHDGPTSLVSADPFDFKDNQVEDKNNGGYIAKEILCARWLQRLCQELNGSNWVQENMGVHKDFDHFIAAFNKENPVKDVYAYFVIGGTKYIKDNGYAAFKYLKIQYADKGDRSIGLKPYSTDESKLIPFNPSKHIWDQTGGASVASFNGNSKSDAAPIKEEEEAPKFNEESDIDFNTPTKTSDNETADDVFAVETDSSNDDLEDVFNVE
jgi:hypothetical protein